MLDVRGLHAIWEKYDLDDLDDDLDKLAHPLLAKRFSQEGKHIPFFSFTSWYLGLGLGGEVPLIYTWMFWREEGINHGMNA